MSVQKIHAAAGEPDFLQTGVGRFVWPYKMPENKNNWAEGGGDGA